MVLRSFSRGDSLTDPFVLPVDSSEFPKTGGVGTYAAHRGRQFTASGGRYGPAGYAVNGLVIQEGEDLSTRTVLATGRAHLF